MSVLASPALAETVHFRSATTLPTPLQHCEAMKLRRTGEGALLDYVADGLGVRGRFAVGVGVAVAEGVEPEGVCHARLPASWRTARSNSGSVSTAPNTGPPGCRTRPALRLSRRTGS